MVDRIKQLFCNHSYDIIVTEYNRKDGVMVSMDCFVKCKKCHKAKAVYIKVKPIKKKREGILKRWKNAFMLEF